MIISNGHSKDDNNLSGHENEYHTKEKENIKGKRPSWSGALSYAALT
jgi:hypothetical protein